MCVCTCAVDKIRNIPRINIWPSSCSVCIYKRTFTVTVFYTVFLWICSFKILMAVWMNKNEISCKMNGGVGIAHK